MLPHVLAKTLSIGHSVTQIGAIAGYAAILGLGVLSLLYFAQAREVKRLREWAGRAPERDAELQARVADEAARRAAAPAAAAATPAGRAAQPGVPAPATTAAATSAGQASAPRPGTPQPAAPAPATAAAVAKAAPAGQAATGSGTAAPQKPGEPTPAPATGQPATGPAAPAPSPSASPRPAPVPPVRAGGAPGAPRPRRTVTVGGAASPSALAAAGRDEPVEHRRPVGRIVAAGVALLAVALVVLGVAGVFGGSGKPAKQHAATAPATTTTTAAVTPADTTVAVLNGTTITGLAARAADQLQTAGYTIGTKTDAADQAQQTSEVAYGRGFEAAARKVARIIGVSSSQVVPIDASTRLVAGDTADVVVTMGADKAQ